MHDLGVLKVAVPSPERRSRVPATNVITTNTKPVKAAADDPMMT